MSGGGNLKDLHNLQILDIHHNSFTNIPEDISLLINLRVRKCIFKHIKLKVILF